MRRVTKGMRSFGGNFVSHWLLLQSVASKETIFMRAAFGSLDASSKITLHKLNLNFLYWPGSCFVALFI